MFVTFGSARWLIEILSAILRHFEKHERTVKRKIVVYERKFKSEYLGRQIYERLLKREPSIVKLIENKSDLSKFNIYIE